MSALVFNLLFNAALSFAVGVGLVLGALLLLRVRSLGLKLYLLALPFVKIVSDLVRWIPADSYLWTGRDPLLAKPGTRWLTMWLGLGDFGPFFGAGYQIETRDGKYSVSAGDMAASYLARHVPTAVLSAAIAGVVLVAAGRLARRLCSYVRFEYQRRQARRSPACAGLSTVSLGRRTVDVYIAYVERGSPHAGGLFRPYVCFPRDAQAILTLDEREAVLQHELAHVRRLDLVQALALELLGDVFWFVPGYGWLKRRIATLREMVADRAAVVAGADPVALASALVRCREARLAPAPAAALAALAKAKSPLRERIELLLAPAPAARTAPLTGRIFAGMLVTAVVCMTGIAGNARLPRTHSFSRYFVEEVAANLGWRPLPF